MGPFKETPFFLPSPPKDRTKKEKAQDIIDMLDADDELQHEFNVLLRKKKLKKIFKDE